MKNYLQLIFLSITFLTFSCRENATDQKTEKIEKQVEISKPKELPKNSDEKKIEIPKHYEHKFVIARSGLNYRDLPKGKVLGKFSLNTHLKIIEYTKIQDQIDDGGKIIKGEWVGVENWISNKKTDTVYVFNGFLSDSYVESDIKLCYASSFYKEQNGNVRTAFLNLSETYFGNTYNESNGRKENLILTEDNLTKDTIRLNNSQTNKFFKFSNISESDKVFIYSINNGNVKTLNVKDLPVIACINIYFHGEQYEKSEFDYEFGFDLEKNSYGDFVFIGKSNPFHNGKLTPMIWKKIDNQYFPKKFNSNIIKDRRRWRFNGMESGQSYKFSTNNLDYFVQDLNKDKKLEHRYMVVVDSETESIIYENVQIDSESTYLIPLRTNNDENYGNQWTGKLFKNKETVIFGFLGHSFGCPSISVLDETELAIPILCDNRH